MSDVVILNYNDYQTTISLIKRIAGFANINHILVVDNNSTDSSFSAIKSECGKDVELIKTNKNGGYGYGNNFGIAYLRRKYHSKLVIVANPDVVFSDNIIPIMENFLENNKLYAVIAPIMHDKNDTIAPNYGWNIPKKSSYIFEMGLIGSKIISKKTSKQYCHSQTIELDAIAGSLIMVNTDLFVEAGGYDENVFLYCEETILGFRLKKFGYRSAVMTNISYVHNHSVSISKTFKSQLKRRKLVLASKLYVLKHYYHANFIEIFLARVISFVSLIETFLLMPFRK